MTTLYLDTETYSETSLKLAGTYRYAEDAEIMLVTYAINNGPVQCWDTTRRDLLTPLGLIDALDRADRIIAHNAMFDRTVLRLGTLQENIPIERWHCTMVQALAHGLPPSLDLLGKTLGLPDDQQKLKDGKKLIQLFCKPRPKNHKLHRATAETHPAEWARFIEYAKQDVATMRECHKRMPDWNYRGKELDLWHLDQRINDRGVAVDRALVEAGTNAAIKEKHALAERFAELTGDYCTPSQRAKLMEYLNARFGLSLDSTAKHVMEPIAKDKTAHPELREIARIVLAANKTSTAKFATIGAALSSDGRFRGGLQFDGASRTRRFAGRKFQPQNLPSRGLPKGWQVANYIDALKAGVHDLLFDRLMLYGSASLRGVVTAEPPKQIVAADLSNIEGRVLAWLAGEYWKLKAFREYDAGVGADLYNLTAVSIIGGDPFDVPKPIRNAFGKVPELALGFASGVHGLQTFAQAYGVTFAEHWDTIKRQLGRDVTDYAAQAYEQRGDKTMDRIEWIASESVKLAWRNRNPNIVRLWNDCDKAARAAIRQPGKWIPAGKRLAYRGVERNGVLWLLCRLPSGRFLTYFDTRIVDNAITYMGMGDENGNGQKVWCRLHTHGGKLVANATQSTARDVLADAMPIAEANGYEIVLSVHDELVTQSENDAIGLSAIMSAGHDWTEGLPLAAAGFEADRYRKED